MRRLRACNEELASALDAALQSDSESDDDTPLSCAKKLQTMTGRNKLMERPEVVPALDFDLMKVKLKELDATEAEAEAARQEAVMAENAAKGESTVLEEVIDPDYVPTEKDIAEYAKFLGLDLKNEPELAWIAHKGLVAPTPPGWKPCAAPVRAPRGVAAGWGGTWHRDGGGAGGGGLHACSG